MMDLGTCTLESLLKNHGREKGIIRFLKTRITLTMLTLNNIIFGGENYSLFDTQKISNVVHTYIRNSWRFTSTVLFSCFHIKFECLSRNFPQCFYIDCESRFVHYLSL